MQRLQGLAQRFDGLESKMQVLDARVMGSRRSTADWAQEINSCFCDSQRIDETLAECNMSDIEQAWSDLSDVRTNLASAKSEEDVQNAVFSAGARCGQGGHLCIRDTHMRLYPGQHKIDLSYTPLSFPEKERVILSMVVTYGELKLCLDTPTVMESACIQIHDRIVAIEEAQFNREYIISYIADKNVIRIFRYEPGKKPGPFISTKCLPFLTTDEMPTEGFARFYRLHRSTPKQLGFPELPVCPTVSDPYHVLRAGALAKASVFMIKPDSGERSVAKVYAVIDKGAKGRMQNEINALKIFQAAKAPVPLLVSCDEAAGLILMKPYGTTLKDCVLFDEDLCCKVANAAGGFLRVAQSMGMVHRDISPENIIIGPDDSVVINDLGSCSKQGVVHSTDGSNLVLCCPVFGSHFEEPSSSAKPFEYTLMNDIRAVFISLFAYCLKPRESRWLSGWEIAMGRKIFWHAE